MASLPFHVMIDTIYIAPCKHRRYAVKLPIYNMAA